MIQVRQNRDLKSVDPGGYVLEVTMINPEQSMGGVLRMIFRLFHKCPASIMALKLCGARDLPVTLCSQANGFSWYHLARNYL